MLQVAASCSRGQDQAVWLDAGVWPVNSSLLAGCLSCWVWVVLSWLHTAPMQRSITNGEATASFSG